MQSLKRTEDEAPIGILLFGTAGDRIAGDPGAQGTFPFPVRRGVVEGSYRDLIEGSPQACSRLCQAARDLEEQGVSAIAGDCGLMALYQRQLAACVRVPVVSSSLILLPLVRTLVGSEGKIGILTGHSALLSARHLQAAGAGADENIFVEGMETRPHFRQVVLEGTCPQEYDKMARDVLRAVEHLLQRSGALDAVMLECSNLATFAWEISSRYKIPVFDINLAIQMLHATLHQTCYQRQV